MKLNVGVISIGFGPFRTDIPNNYLKESIEYIGNLDHSVFSNNQIIIDEESFAQDVIDLKKSNLDLLVIQLGTFSKGEWMVKLIKEFEHIPFLLWGFNDPIVNDFPTVPMNSLTAINMFTSFLYQMDKQFSYIYDTFNQGNDFKKLDITLKALKVRKSLNNAKFLVIGSRVPGFYLSGVDELRLRKEIGVEIEYYSIATLIEAAKNVSSEAVEERFNNLDVIIEDKISVETVKKSLRIEIALLDYARHNKIDGMSLKCWPELQELYGVSACGVISTLIDEGIMASCEGDITGLTTMYILNQITNKPVFFGDLVGKSKNGRIKLWHCGLGPKGLAKKGCKIIYTEQPTMRNGIGVGVQYLMKTGKASLCKLSQGRENFRLFVALGECFDPDRELAGVQTDIQLVSGFDKVINIIFKEGIEHHFALVHSDVVEVLEELTNQMNIELIDVEKR